MVTKQYTGDSMYRRCVLDAALPSSQNLAPCSTVVAVTISCTVWNARGIDIGLIDMVPFGMLMHEVQHSYALPVVAGVLTY